MHYYLLALSCVVLYLVLIHVSNLYIYNDIEYNRGYQITRYDNGSVPALNPPTELTIDANKLSCHSTLTRCTSNADCQLCSESLASCVEFNETVILEIGNSDDQLVVESGDKYCLALDSRSARSCNPSAGVWVMRQVDGESYALICHCTAPGLVTQLNIYDDCTFPVGCKPHGYIADVYTWPMTCVCESNYVSELSNTYTPYCRPKVMRDVVLQPEFYHRPPCNDGFLPAEHPAFDPVYRRQIGANVCLPDPCSIDPLTGERHNGRVLYEPNGGSDGGPLVMCLCNINDDLYPVYNAASMLNSQYSNNDWIVANVCIKPLTVNRRQVRSDIKVFWGRNSLKSDADMVFQVDEHHVHKPYKVLLSRRSTNHPTVALNTNYVLKFKLSSAFVASAVNSALFDVFQGYWRLNYLRSNNVNSCPLPGIGLCTNPQVCGNISCSYNPCIRNVASVGYRDNCYFFSSVRHFDDVGSVGQICVWNAPTYYNNDNVPVTFYINALCATDGGYGVSNDVRTFYFTNTKDTVDASQYNTVVQLLATYPFYSS
nr:pif-1 [Darna trima granulovirus]